MSTIIAETAETIPGPAGAIEALLSSEAKTEKGLAIICHPHPLYGGTMNNKVVTTLLRTFQLAGVQTLRFNFRGVGKSEGRFALGVGELLDVEAIFTWAEQKVKPKQFWLAGFSFGAYLAILTAEKKKLAGLVSVAPPVNHFPFSQPPVVTCPWLVIHGAKDELVPLVEVERWVKTLSPQPRFVVLEKATHFFHGQLIPLREEASKIFIM